MKKVLTMLLAMVMCVAMGAAALAAELAEPADPSHVKSITNDGQVADEYTISLNVKGQSKTTTSTTTGETTTSPYDILLVLDNTTSMQGTYGSTTRLAAMKEAAKSFVNRLPASDNAKIAMISFVVGNYQSPTTLDVNWTALGSGRGSVTSAISSLTAPNVTYGYDTCFTQPLQKASSMMSSVSGDGNKKFVVFFTDGSAAETAGQIEPLAADVKRNADATFSIGITQYWGDEEKASVLATSGNYYDVTSAGTMRDAFASALQTITSQTTVTKAPMTGVTIKDTLSDYVELSKPDDENKGVTLTAAPADSDVSIGSVEVSGKEVTVTLSGDLTDDTVYTVSIPVKPSEKAHTEANAASDSLSKFASNASASLTYQYGSEAAKTSDYKETPQIAVAKQFTLTYDDNVETDEISVPEAQTAASDGKVTVSETAPAREGYTFLGWSTDRNAAAADEVYKAGSEVTLTENTTLYAVWQINTHTVTFDVQGHGTAPEAQPVNHNATAARPETDPSETGYTFGGWYTDADCTTEYNFDTSVTEDITVYAKWTQTDVSYTVKHFLQNLDDEEYTEQTDDVQRLNGKVGEITAAAAKEYAGFTAKQFEQKMIVADDTTVVEIYYDRNQHSVNYSVTGDVPSDSTTPTGGTYKYGAPVAVAPSLTSSETKGTWTFSGWTTSDAEVIDNAFIMPDSDVTITGSWTFAQDTYTVTFDSAGGSAVDPQGVESGLTATEPAVPTKDGYTFKGWALNGSDYDFSTPVTDNITLTAQWEQNQSETPAPTPDPDYTVDTSEKGHTYEIYQIFTGDYTEKDGKAILSNLVWGENGTSNDANNSATVGQPVPDSIINALKALTGGEVKPSDKQKLAEIEKYVSMTSTTNYPKVIKSENGEQVKITDLPAGYYLIKDKDGTQTEQDDSYTLYITQIVKNYTIQPKSVKPTVDKQVSDDDEGDKTSSSDNVTNKNAEKGWYESADHAIGESFKFRLIATLPASPHYADYSSYKLVFTDTMSAGVTFDGIASVSVGSKEVPAEGYSVSGVSKGQADKTWTLTINDVKSVQSDLSDGAVVTVVYNAHLNENAIVHKASAESTDTNKNTVSLQYSNNPNTDHGEDMGKTASDSVWVFTYGVDNIKKKNSENGDPLPNAGFKLYDGTGAEVPLTYNEEKSVYLPAAAGAAGVEMKSGSDGKFNIIGLDAGTYKLKETTTPDGYNKCEDTTVNISAQHSENLDTATAKLDLGLSNTDNTIINTSGTALPSTGGIGTRIFYILGTILVLGAGVVLVSRRRSRDN